MLSQNTLYHQTLKLQSIKTKYNTTLRYSILQYIKVTIYQEYQFINKLCVEI